MTINRTYVYFYILMCSVLALYSVASSQTSADYEYRALEKYKSGRLLDAIEDLEKALELANHMKDKEQIVEFEVLIAKLHSELGLSLINLGDCGNALFHLEKSLNTAKKYGFAQPEAYELTNLGAAETKCGDYEKALSRLEEALKINNELKDTDLDGVILANIGTIYMNKGKYMESLSILKKALETQQSGGNTKGVGRDLVNIGLIYQYLGDYAKAIEHIEEGRKTLRKSADTESEEECLVYLGEVYFAQDNYQMAQQCYEQVLSLFNVKLEMVEKAFKEMKDDPEYQDVWKSCDINQIRESYKLKLKEDSSSVRNTMAKIGDIYLKQGRNSEAFDMFFAVNDLFGLGVYFLQEQDYWKAKAAFEASLNGSNKESKEWKVIADRIGLGLSYEMLKGYEKAMNYYQEAVRFTEQERDFLESSLRSRFLSGKNRWFTRLEPYEGLVRVSFNSKHFEDSFFWAENCKARVLLESITRKGTQGSRGIPDALASQEAQIINRIAAIQEQMDHALETRNIELYRGLNEELLKLRQEKAKTVAQLRRDHPEYAAIRYPQPIRVKELKLYPGEILVEYEVTDKETLAWVIRGTEVLKAVSIPVTREELTEKVKAFRRGFEVGETRVHHDLSRFDPSLGKSLYDLVFHSFISYMKEGESVIIVPDEILATLPFETLVVGLSGAAKTGAGKYGPYPEGVKYLGDSYRISYYQSGSALSLARTIKKRVATNKEKMLVVADPVFDLADGRIQKKMEVAKPDDFQLNLRRVVGENWQTSKKETVFPRLEATGRIADELGKSYGKAVDLLRGSEATEERLRKRPLKDYQYLIFATHGILDNEVPYIKEPALVLSQVGVDPKDRANDGFLTMSEVLDLKLNSDVAALTACNTGLGKNLTGEGVMGMGRAFQYAGAKSVLMSLWSVEDESTNLLTEKFFNYIKQGKDRLEALRLSRADIRKAGYEHPFYWAPFILVGEK